MSEDFLSRWSRRKREAKAGTPSPEPKAPAPPPPAAPPTGSATPASSATPPAPPPLPPVESLEPGADIAQFMRAEVEESLKRQAVKKLLQDPRFNVMDGLDVYIDDYSKPDPLPEGWLEKMNPSWRLDGGRQEPRPEEPDALPDAQPASADASEEAPPAAAPESTPQAEDTQREGSARDP